MPTLNLFQIHPLRCAGLVGLENDADYLSATESPLWLGRKRSPNQWAISALDVSE
jgi:hypothetical protein